MVNNYTNDKTEHFRLHAEIPVQVTQNDFFKIQMC